VTVELDWVRRNIPEVVGVPAVTDDVQSVARSRQLDIIEFDSEAPGTALYRESVAGVAEATGLSQFVDIKWPDGLAPTPSAPPAGEGLSLPKADVLIVTWTMDEGHALARVLTPGFDSRDNWRAYTKNYDVIAAEMRLGCPARNYGRLGTYWCTTIGDTSVTLFKSDSHMSQDGPALPNAKVWRQIIEDVSPRWVITTGTGGGIGTRGEVGDVVLSRYVAFDCQREFKSLNGHKYACPVHARLEHLPTARSLFKYNRPFLPPTNTRTPTTDTAQSSNHGILTTDFFGFDNTDNTYGLQGKGDLSEMGDAVLGMVCASMDGPAPNYIAVRNVSDPQISAAGMTLPQQARLAAEIYKTYGRWSSVCSAIVCWAIAAGV
jgi:nucleoside phosphorylase